MSERSPTDVLLEWFKNNLPKDYDLQEEVVRRAEEVFRRVVMQPPQTINQPIFIGVSNNLNDPSRPGISMNVYGIIFIGVMAKAILDSLSGEFQALLSSPIGNEVIEKKVKEVVSQRITSNMKKCPQCQSEIRMNAQFCDQCGRKLES